MEENFFPFLMFCWGNENAGMGFTLFLMGLFGNYVAALCAGR